jgi:hypothetical protein
VGSSRQKRFAFNCPLPTACCLLLMARQKVCYNLSQSEKIRPGAPRARSGANTFPEENFYARTLSLM